MELLQPGMTLPALTPFQRSSVFVDDTDSTCRIGSTMSTAAFCVLYEQIQQLVDENKE
jgi:hypothetical protein